MQFLIDQFRSLPSYQAYLTKNAKVGNLSLYEEALLIVSQYQDSNEPVVILKSNAYQAQKLYQAVISLISQDECFLYLQEEALRVSYIASSPEQKADQLEIIAKVCRLERFILITHTAALMYPLGNPTYFKESIIDIAINDIYEFEDLKKALVLLGYQSVSRVDQPLTFASRGGIIDIYSMNYDHPIRIEFFDNEIDSIRFFDIGTQRTIEKANKVEIIPASLYLFSLSEREIVIDKIHSEMAKLNDLSYQEKLTSSIESEIEHLEIGIPEERLQLYYGYLDKRYNLLDYLSSYQLVVASEEEVTNAYKHIEIENVNFIQELVSEAKALPIYNAFIDINKQLYQANTYLISQFIKNSKYVNFDCYELIEEDGNTSLLVSKLVKLAKDNLVVIALKEHELAIIKGMLHDLEQPILDKLSAHGIYLIEKELLNGFQLKSKHVYVYTSKELFKRKVKLGRYHNKFKDAERLSSYLELEKGDFVVHSQHGIGQFIQIVTREVLGVKKDFLHVAYKGEDSLYVPVDQFKLIRKFVSKEGMVVKLNKLGSKDWERTKAKLQENVNDLAERLVKLYALRDQKIGYAYSKDDALQLEFESDFPHQLTVDQKQVVKEIKTDMESDKVMDRLLCGDVGFGKTEVALRAIFKAVTNNKQVAYLCPTTILASQHYKTFIKRLSNFPVKVALLNRFTTAKEVRTIIEELANGQLDIVIGTHRILSNDVKYKDLGLLVIDEEQRFGVEHKEKIKELKNSIDVLSLSATPIPRTLQMSLIGIRSLSQLNTPPQNRIPVQTYVVERNYDLIKEVIERELSRDGQIFFLHNNVKTIYEVARKISKKLPHIKIGVAHGQMDKTEIEQAMIDFIEHRYQVLVCTTIIETGIDIPNANTIIVDDADRFGLSQLYQIKGRVGRSDRLAYAYLMYQPNKQISEIAQKRLKAIKEFTQLGSGYKIAMRDLTIRGAGDLLGPNQAGFIDSVGIDLYLEMLQEAIAKEKGIEVEKPKAMTQLNLKVDGYIPNSFSDEDGEKLTIYQKIDCCSDKQDLFLLMEDIEDNYGKLPKEVAVLFEKKRLEILINEPNIAKFSESERYVELFYTKEVSKDIDGVKLFSEVGEISKDIQIRYTNAQISLKITKVKGWMGVLIKVLDTLKLVKK